MAHLSLGVRLHGVRVLVVRSLPQPSSEHNSLTQNYQSKTIKLAIAARSGVTAKTVEIHSSSKQ